MKVLHWILTERCAKKSIRVDNCAEFVSRTWDRSAYEHQVTVDFSRRGKPTDDAYVESFNGRLHEQCVNAN